MARETRKRTASARDADDAPAEERRGRASAGPSGSARDAKAVKREKAQKGKAPVVEAVIDLDEEEEDDEFNEQNDADIAQMVRPLYGVFFEHAPFRPRTRPRPTPASSDASRREDLITPRSRVGSGCQHRVARRAPRVYLTISHLRTHKKHQTPNTRPRRTKPSSRRSTRRL
jgi:hypothetical protein